MRTKLVLTQSGRTVRIQYKKAIRARDTSETGVMAVPPEKAGLSREFIDQEMGHFIDRSRNNELKR